jgi:hypothetical protein
MGGGPGGRIGCEVPAGTDRCGVLTWWMLIKVAFWLSSHFLSVDKYRKYECSESIGTSILLVST